MLKHSYCLHAALSGPCAWQGRALETWLRSLKLGDSCIQNSLPSARLAAGPGNWNATHAPGAMHNTLPPAGEWATGMRSGFGTCWYPGGDIYQGEWRAGRRHGEGSQHCAALEAQYIGDWCAEPCSKLCHSPSGAASRSRQPTNRRGSARLCWDLLGGWQIP